MKGKPFIALNVLPGSIGRFSAVPHWPVLGVPRSVKARRRSVTRASWLLRFSEHREAGLWNLIPVNDALRRRTSALMVSAPRDLFLRTADAVHLTTALQIGERDVWTNDRHMLAAAACFGLTGRSV